MTSFQEFIDNRIESHRKAIKALANIENVRRRHPAYKQLHGRILELQIIKKELEHLSK